MRTYETSVRLSLKPDGENIYLVVDIKLPQFAGKKIKPPLNHIYEGGDMSKIKFIFEEYPSQEADVAFATHIQKTYEVFIGKCSLLTTSSTMRDMKKCAQETPSANNTLLSRYDVNVEVGGPGGRNTKTFISDDADIDLYKNEITENTQGIM